MEQVGTATAALQSLVWLYERHVLPGSRACCEVRQAHFGPTTITCALIHLPRSHIARLSSLLTAFELCIGLQRTHAMKRGCHGPIPVRLTRHCLQAVPPMLVRSHSAGNHGQADRALLRVHHTSLTLLRLISPQLRWECWHAAGVAAGPQHLPTCEKTTTAYWA